MPCHTSVRSGADRYTAMRMVGCLTIHVRITSTRLGEGTFPAFYRMATGPQALRARRTVLSRCLLKSPKVQPLIGSSEREGVEDWRVDDVRVGRHALLHSAQPVPFVVDRRSRYSTLVFPCRRFRGRRHPSSRVSRACRTWLQSEPWDRVSRPRAHTGAIMDRKMSGLLRRLEGRCR